MSMSKEFSKAEFDSRLAELEEGRAKYFEIMLSGAPCREIAIENCKRETKFHASYGWYEISERQKQEMREKLHSIFYEESSFFPNPFVTWDVAHVMDCFTSQRVSFERDIENKVLAALKRCKNHSFDWFALTRYTSVWYQVDAGKMPENLADWPIEIIPWTDPCFLVNSDMNSGIIAELGGPITVFGEPFFGELLDDLPLALTIAVEKSASIEW